MRLEAINKIYTEKVNEYITKGYFINSTSMAGSQGEIAKIDLVKGNELLRIWMNSESDYNWSDPDAWSDRKVVIRVSRWIHPHDPRRDITVWMNELEHLEEYTYYDIGDFFGNHWYLDNLSEALECVSKRKVRRRYASHSYYNEYIESARDVAAKYLKRKHRYQRVSKDKIRVYKRVYRDNTTPEYFINYNNHVYKLNQK